MEKDLVYDGTPLWGLTIFICHHELRPMVADVYVLCHPERSLPALQYFLNEKM